MDDIDPCTIHSVCDGFSTMPSDCTSPSSTPQPSIFVTCGDDQVIEDKLGDKGIVCLEDLIQEIVTVGPNFKVCAQLHVASKSLRVAAHVTSTSVHVANVTSTSVHVVSTAPVSRVQMAVLVCLVDSIRARPLESTALSSRPLLPSTILRQQHMAATSQLHTT